MYLVAQSLEDHGEQGNGERLGRLALSLAEGDNGVEAILAFSSHSGLHTLPAVLSLLETAG